MLFLNTYQPSLHWQHIILHKTNTCIIHIKLPSLKLRTTKILNSQVLHSSTLQLEMVLSKPSIKWESLYVYDSHSGVVDILT